MKLSIMQPYFFPYIGYFQLIHSVDKFIFYDDVNFIKKGWIHRNNILINDQSFLFSVPCKKISQNKKINETEVNFNEDEKNKFLKRIELAYKKAPCFQTFFPKLETFIMNEHSKLISTLAWNSIMFVTEYLGIHSQFEYSSAKHGSSVGMEKQQRLQHIAKKEGAKTYINAMGGKELYSKESFKMEGITLKFLKTEPIEYPQGNSSFVPWLSIIDVLMYNTKTEANKLILQYKLE
ncbi:WbqC family protein [Marixanthomonas ophiurae]|uniref:Glycine transferase n=1 Tax=Marixanthomonas ophiurae TaxID=387659 RepID=A0A3E1QD53_9FLAO|nr:WbqC family protein [Marixanthomonas ophiurae]RFN60037.1 hypothetical protein DZ858_08310 [Marixanthomonas ophiurae]